MNELARALPVVSRRATRSLLDAWTWGVELRLWVATCVSGLSLFVAKVSGFPMSGPDSTTTRLSALICFFATLALYNLDGTLDSPRPSDSKARRRAHLILTALSALVLLVLLVQLSPAAFVFVLLGALLCGLYAIPISSGGASNRIKALPYLKGPFVGTAVATAVVWVPVGAQPHVTLASQWENGDALLLTLILALYCTANAILFDVPDVGDDRENNIPTLPAQSGLRRTKLLCAGLSATALALSTFSGFAHSAALIALGVALLVASWRITKETTKRTVAWWVDGALLLPLLLS